MIGPTDQWCQVPSLWYQAFHFPTNPKPSTARPGRSVRTPVPRVKRKRLPFGWPGRVQCTEPVGGEKSKKENVEILGMFGDFLNHAGQEGWEFSLPDVRLMLGPDMLSWGLKQLYRRIFSWCDWPVKCDISKTGFHDMVLKGAGSTYPYFKRTSCRHV